ncbi:MAG: T9SS C-terminal target domain-containing protein [Chitinophagaceae bacterium]|nr:MAG: T9SS C-terminal target domain-containing protein [Chitinophagaceae bacterium]
MSFKEIVLLFIVCISSNLSTYALSDNQKIDSLLFDFDADLSLIVFKDKNIVYQKLSESFLQKDVQTINAGEITKAITATVILALIDNNYFSLESQLKDLLENVPENYRQITVEQLLNHQSGLPAYSSVLDNRNLSNEQMVQRILSRESLFLESGTDFFYSQLSYNFLVSIAENTTGKKWSDIFYTYLALPAGLSGSFFNEKDDFYRSNFFQTNMQDLSSIVSVWLNYGMGRNNQVFSREQADFLYSGDAEKVNFILPEGETSRFLIQRPYSAGFWIDEKQPPPYSSVRLLALSGGNLAIIIDECSRTAFILYKTKPTSKMAEYARYINNFYLKISQQDCLDGLVPEIFLRDKDKLSLPEIIIEREVSSVTPSINFSLNEFSDVTITFFDPLGNELFTFLNEGFEAGNHQFELKDIDSGLYFYRIRTSEKNVTKKILIP